MGTGGVLLRKLRAKVISEPTNFSWVQKGRLAASGYPSSCEQVQWIARRGVDTIVSLTETPIPEAWVEGTGVTTKHIPMADHTLPTPERLEVAADCVGKEVASKHVVLVHCLAGKGRTGSVLAAYLMKSEGMTSEEALRYLRKNRPGSVERAQERALREFESRLRAASR